jgi:hypothetical protein
MSRADKGFDVDLLALRQQAFSSQSDRHLLMIALALFADARGLFRGWKQI